jgi:radical SAM superfamily enzyme YgiQ (UPF0313 family)
MSKRRKSMIKKELGDVHFSRVRPQIADLDRMPLLNRSFVDYEKYNQFIGQSMVKDCMSLQATRGCPYRCVYCHKIWPKTHMVRSAENIFAEIQVYYHMGVTRFAFVDDIFNLDIKNSSRFYQLIIKNKLKVQLFFPNGLRGDILTREYIDLMVEAGTVNIAFALETASPRLQKLTRKNLHIEKFRENLQYTCETYPEIILELQTMHGFPTETREEALMTLDFIFGIKWLDFPYINVLKIFPNTDMEKLALENGVSKQAIARSCDLAYDELPDTLPFSKSFSYTYQAKFLHEYFLAKERLLHILPYQMKLFNEDELIQKYNSYMPGRLNSLADLLEITGIDESELEPTLCSPINSKFVPHLNQKIRNYFPGDVPAKDAFKILLLDLSLFFSKDRNVLYDVVEPPLGLMYLLTYLKHQLGNRINGKIAKSHIDFDTYEDLNTMLAEFKPDVIGIRTLTLFKHFFHDTVSMIRKWGFKAPIIAGGPYATSDCHSILQDVNIDLVVLGEGEITFYEVITAIMENNRGFPNEKVLEEIAGLAFVPGRSTGKRLVGDNGITETKEDRKDRQKQMMTQFNDDLENE